MEFVDFASGPTGQEEDQAFF